MKKTLKILIWIVAIYFVLCAGFGVVVAEKFVHPELNSFEEEAEKEAEYGFDAFYYIDSLHPSEHECVSEDGYVVHYEIFECPGSRKMVVLAHGYNGNRINMMPHVVLFHDLGYNCVVFDQRGHGYDEPRFVSFGYYEEMDVRAVAKDAQTQIGKQDVVGFAGMSMGAATVLMAAEKTEKLDFIVEDSSFAESRDMLIPNVPGFVLKFFRPFIPAMDAYLKLRYGFSTSSVNPLRSVSAYPESLPVLFFHSEADKKVPYSPAFEELYDAKKGIKVKVSSKTADHTMMILEDPESYKKSVADFLEKYVER